MRKLTCISTDSLNYEEENLEFLYNSHVVFKQYNRPLNRGGKSLVLADITVREELVTSGPYRRGKIWFKEMIAHFEKLSYTITIEEIEEAIKLRRQQNTNDRISVLQHNNRSLKKDIEGVEKQLKKLHSTLKDNSSEIKRLESWKQNT